MSSSAWAESPSIAGLDGKPLPASSAMDWSGAGALVFEAGNTGTNDVTLKIDIDDLHGEVDLSPGQVTSLLVPFLDDDFGMAAQPVGPDPGRPGIVDVGRLSGRLDRSHVTGVRVSPDSPDVAVSGFRLDRDAGRQDRYGHIADAYGQDTRVTWSEKVASDADLRRPVDIPPSRFSFADRYGGLSNPEVFHATGFFHAEKTARRWWLVTPEGHAFFSLGVDAITATARTTVAGRESMFAWLPGQDDPLSAFYGPDGRHDWFDVYAANLRRGLGPDWRALWTARTLERLRAWNFNTVGNWSDPELCAPRLLPCVATLDVEGSFAMVAMDSDSALPDPYDPVFASRLDAAARSLALRIKGDPWILGVFAGNELPWRVSERLAVRVLASGDIPAKQAFVSLLRGRYGTIDRLAAGWGVVAPSSWDILSREPFVVPAALSPQATQDFLDFESGFADTYYRLLAQTWRRHDADHLFLGTRFHRWIPEAVRACARWCDVMSFNIYRRSPEDSPVAPLWHSLDKPVLMGEFHFGSPDRGSFWPGVVDVGSEDRRGPAYADYVSAAASDPQVVGAHWFQYADEPLTGRVGDGENGHIGLVAITDVPYEGFVAAVAAANREVYGRLETDVR